MSKNNYYNKNHFYNSLNIKPINQKDNDQLCVSINKLFQNSSVSSFNSIFYKFSIYNLDDVELNHTYKLLKLLSKKKRVHTNGYIYKAILKSSKNNRKLYSNIFIKECPLWEPTRIELSHNKITLNPYHDFLVSYQKHSFHSSSNVELFVSYITSKIVEQQLCPHFPMFYGFKYVILDKFTSDISIDEYELLVKKTEMGLNNEFIKIRQTNDNLFMERQNFPCNLLFSEKLELLDFNTFNTCDKWLSCIFQIIFSIGMLQHLFKLCHNDLHTSNIMFKPTKLEYLYYQIQNKYFALPTFGKIIKIIDWGRCTYDFNGFTTNNNIFFTDGNAFGHYIYPRINQSGKPSQNAYNDSGDLVIFGMSIFNEPNFAKIGVLYDFVKSWFIDKSGKFRMMDSSSFEFYQSLYLFDNANPFKQIQHEIWDRYEIPKSKIDELPPETIIYKLMDFD